MLAVSGYWNLKGKSRSASNHEWYINSLNKSTNFNTDYIIYGNNETNTIIKKARNTKITHDILLEWNDLIKLCEKEFNCNNILEKLSCSSLHIIEDPNRYHCPSSELVLIWLSKIVLVKKSIELKPKYTHFGWIDAGYKGLDNRNPPENKWPSDNLENIKGIYIKRDAGACHSYFWNKHYSKDCPIGCMWFGDKLSISLFVTNCINIITNRLKNNLSLCNDQDVYYHALNNMKNVYETKDKNNYKPFYISDF